MYRVTTEKEVFNMFINRITSIFASIAVLVFSNSMGFIPMRN
nr:hypothetical protein DGKKSRWO_DGKKSRWO_CDS_0011 [uncultured phage]CAI9752117.1 hypothetical protein CVNMHQAP_CVNMHQAP_CDS_0011 [uncultured phage]